MPPSDRGSREGWKVCKELRVPQSDREPANSESPQASAPDRPALVHEMNNTHHNHQRAEDAAERSRAPGGMEGLQRVEGATERPRTGKQRIPELFRNSCLPVFCFLIFDFRFLFSKFFIPVFFFRPIFL